MASGLPLHGPQPLFGRLLPQPSQSFSLSTPTSHSTWSLCVVAQVPADTHTLKSHLLPQQLSRWFLGQEDSCVSCYSDFFILFQLVFGELGQCLGPHLQCSGSGRMHTPGKLVLRWPEVKKERCWLRWPAATRKVLWDLEPSSGLLESARSWLPQWCPRTNSQN